jgi:deoxyribodipyrimidine photolyase-related protein
MSKPKILRLILGDQLNYQHSWFEENNNVIYILAEIRSETDYCSHHIQKVCAFFLAMQHFAKWLESRGANVIYLDLDQTKKLPDFSTLIKTYVSKLKIEHFVNYHFFRQLYFKSEALPARSGADWRAQAQRRQRCRVQHG